MAQSLSELVGGIGSKIRSFPGLTARNDDPKLVKDLDEKLALAKEARRPYEGQWLVNLAFYFAKQWVIWSTATQQLEKPSVEPWRVMPNINFVRPAVLTAYAKIVKERQAARTQPAGDNPDDEAAARACDKLLNFLWPVTKSEDAMRKAAVWMLICGTGLIKTCWDKSFGLIVGQDPKTGDDLHMGEVQSYAISPFDFYGEPGCDEVDEMEWCFHVTIRPISYIKKMYNIDVQESDYDSAMTFESQLKTIISGDSSKTKGAILKEYYERPNRDNPNGRMVIYVNDQIIEDVDNPYTERPLPFIEMRANPRPDSFWGVSFVDDMIDPQRVYNKTKGESIEIQRLSSKPSWLKPIGSMPEGKEITNAPSQEIPYLPVQGLKPEQVKGIDIPTGYFKVMENTRSELYDASGQHEVSHGQSPYTRTAAGIAYLQEQDDQRLAPMIRNYDRAYELLEESKLDIAREYYAEDRTLKILGQDNKTEVVTFYKNQIPNDVHVHIQAGGQALPRSRVARQDLILKIWTTTPPILDDPKLIIKLLEFGEIEGIYDVLNQDVSQAGRENDQIMALTAAGANVNVSLKALPSGATQPPQQGTPTPIGQASPNGAPSAVPGQQGPAVRDFHNHTVHMKEHNKMRNSVAYEQAPQNVQQAFDAHVAAHQQMYTQQVQNMQAAMQGQQAVHAGAISTHTQPPARAMGSGLGALAEPAAPAGQFTQGQPGGGTNAQ